jgi:YVTN family beta-propeller protein
MAQRLAGRFAPGGSGAFVIWSMLTLSLLTLSAAASVAAPPVLVPGPWIPVEDALGRFNTLAVDPAAHRLMAAHANDDTADFFDLDTHRLIARVEVGPVVALAVDPKTGRYFASVQDDKRIAIIDPKTFQETGSIPLPGDTGAILFEARNRLIYVASDESPALWVVDPETRKIVATIRVPNESEGLAWAPGAGRIYLNSSGSNQVSVIDTATKSVVAHWPTAPAVRPQGLAVDEARGRLFIAGDNGQLVALDLKTGRVMATAAIGLHTVQIALDAGLRRIYCAAPDWITVVQCVDDRLEPIGKTYTAATATNVAVDPATHAVWTTMTDGEDGYAKSWLPK